MMTSAMRNSAESWRWIKRSLVHVWEVVDCIPCWPFGGHVRMTNGYGMFYGSRNVKIYKSKMDNGIRMVRVVLDRAVGGTPDIMSGWISYYRAQFWLCGGLDPEAIVMARSTLPPLSFEGESVVDTPVVDTPVNPEVTITSIIDPVSGIKYECPECHGQAVLRIAEHNGASFVRCDVCHAAMDAVEDTLSTERSLRSAFMAVERQLADVYEPPDDQEI